MTSTTSIPPDWAAVGSTVLVVQDTGSYTQTTRVRRAVVDRIGKAQIITSQGRFRIADLREVGRDRYGAPQLMDPAGDEGQAAMRRAAVQDARHEVHATWSAWEKVDRNRRSMAGDEDDALDQLVTAATEYRRLLAGGAP